MNIKITAVNNDWWCEIDVRKTYGYGNFEGYSRMWQGNQMSSEDDFLINSSDSTLFNASSSNILDEIEKILDMFFEDAFGHNNYDEDEILIHFSMNKIVKLKRNFGKRHIRDIFGFISN